MLAYEGYLYSTRKNTVKEIWRCVDRSCAGRCHPANDAIKKQSSRHYHAVYTGKLEIHALEQS
jgi:hypothetical protein